MYRLAFLAFVASVSANVMVESRCPVVAHVDNFDFDTYGQGIWYEIARYPNAAETNAQCGFAELLPEGDIVRVRNIHVVDNRFKIIEGFHQRHPCHNGKVLVNLPYGINGTIVEFHLNVLAYTDDYLIGYHCKEYATRGSHQDFAWVLSRSKIPSAETKAAIKKFLQESKILDSKRFIWPSFSDEDCKVHCSVFNGWFV